MGITQPMLLAQRAIAVGLKAKEINH